VIIVKPTSSSAMVIFTKEGKQKNCHEDAFNTKHALSSLDHIY